MALRELARSFFILFPSAPAAPVRLHSPAQPVPLPRKWWQTPAPPGKLPEDLPADGPLAAPLGQGLHLGCHPHLVAVLVEGGHPPELGRVDHIGVALAGAFRRQAHRLQHRIGLRGIGDLYCDHRHIAAPGIVDHLGNVAVGDNDLLALKGAQIGHPHGSGLHIALLTVHLDVIPHRKLIFKHEKKTGDHILHQALGAKADGNAADSGGDDEVVDQIPHPQLHQGHHQRHRVHQVPEGGAGQRHHRIGAFSAGLSAVIAGGVHHMAGEPGYQRQRKPGRQKDGRHLEHRPQCIGQQYPGIGHGLPEVAGELVPEGPQRSGNRRQQDWHERSLPFPFCSGFLRLFYQICLPWKRLSAKNQPFPLLEKRLDLPVPESAFYDSVSSSSAGRGGSSVS